MLPPRNSDPCPTIQTGGLLIAWIPSKTLLSGEQGTLTQGSEGGRRPDNSSCAEKGHALVRQSDLSERSVFNTSSKLPERAVAIQGNFP